MAAVPRELFVPEIDRRRAYADRALPIGHGQTISQPFMVATICALLRLKGEERVLDVGTGSGYQAAVLAELAAEVVTVERVSELAEQARRTLAAAGYERVEVRVGDGTLGVPERAPFQGDRGRRRRPGRPAGALRPTRRGRSARRAGGEPPRPAAAADRRGGRTARTSRPPFRAASSRSSVPRASERVPRF